MDKEVTLTVQVSIPVSMVFEDRPVDLVELRQAAIENFMDHPALKNARDLELYIDSISSGEYDVTCKP